MISSLSSLVSGPDAARLRRTVILAVLAGITQGIAVLLTLPVITSLFRGDFGAATRWFLFLLAAAAAHCVCMCWAMGQGYVSSMGIIRAMHSRLSQRLVRLPLGWFSGDTPGRASHVAVKGTMFVATTAMDIMVPVIVHVVSPLTLVLGAYLVDWRIALALTVSAPVVYLSAKLAVKWESDGKDAEREVNRETDTRLLEFARSQVELRSSDRALGYQPLWDAIEQQRKTCFRTLWLTVAGMVVQSFVVNFVFGAVVGLAVWLALRPGNLDPITAIALVGLIAQFTGPLRIIASLGTSLRQSETEIKGVANLLATPPLPEPEQPVQFPKRTDVELRDVDFSYDGSNNQVLKGMNLQIPNRTVAALVGPSGTGKTTVVRLIARLWDITGGSVTIGGVDLRDMATADLYQNVSMIFQDVYLFDDTLWANVALGNPDATEEEIYDAARRARVTEIAERLPDGWDTRVGESGSLLSGGERQRVSVARALLRHAPLILCDEPNSALDPTTRAAVTEALSNLAEEATVVIVAHQLETIRDADQIFLIESGRVAAHGTHEELAATSERYREFWSVREAAGKWRLTAAQ